MSMICLRNYLGFSLYESLDVGFKLIWSLGLERDVVLVEEIDKLIAVNASDFTSRAGR